MVFIPGKDYQKTTASKVIIRFQDCDPLGHLNNAKYFDYYFNARDDQVPKLYEVDLVKFYKEYQSAWVIYNHNISYIRPAYPGEWVRIYSRLIAYDESTILLEYFMTDEKCEVLKNVLWSTMKFVDYQSGKRKVHEGAVLDFVKAIHHDVGGFDQIDHMQRIKTIKEELPQLLSLVFY